MKSGGPMLNDIQGKIISFNEYNEHICYFCFSFLQVSWDHRSQIFNKIIYMGIKSVVSIYLHIKLRYQMRKYISKLFDKYVISY